MKLRRRFHPPLAAARLVVALFFLAGCAAIDDIDEVPLTDQDFRQLQQVEEQMLQGYSPEVEIDRRISEAVRQMVATLRPEYKRNDGEKHRMGFLEISDIDRRTVSRFHHYVTEKTLTFTFLQKDIAANFNIVERFLLKDVLEELRLQNVRNPRVIDSHLAKYLGHLYDIDIIETGVVTDGGDYVDINLRMIETQRGRIVAVGSAKIEANRMVRTWLRERVERAVGWPELPARRR
ncbi:MAG: hypothetical protein ACOC98_03390 [Thermodesulfobacteriota bacterium]